jgi:hypothetical protein
MPGSAPQQTKPFRGGGARSSSAKNSFFKGSHVVYQMNGFDEWVSDFIFWGPSKGVGQGHQVQNKFLKGSHVVYQMKGYRVYYSCPGGVDV